MPPPTSSAEQLIQARNQRSELSSYVSLGGLASLSAGALCYLLSLHQGRKANELAGAISVETIADLAGVALPALVAIRGRVNSGKPVKCELSDNKLAVIKEVVEEEVWRKQRAEGRTVYEPFETRKVFEECEWFVEDGSVQGGGARVKVENALQAGKLRSVFEVKSEFVPEDVSQKSLSKVLMEKAWQMTKHGMRKTERCLPVGAVVTCVGEVSQNTIRTGHDHGSSSSSGSSGGISAASSSSSSPASSAASSPSGSHASSGSGRSSGSSSSSSGSPSTSGLPSGLLAPLGALSRATGGNTAPSYVIRKPANGGPSYITPLTFDQLKAALSSNARNCRFLAYALGAVGAVLLVRKAMSRLLQRMHERRVRARVAAVEAARKARKRAAASSAPPCAACGAQRPVRAGDAAGAEGQQGEGAAAAGSSGASSYNGDREPDTCVICLEEYAETVFTQCGHMCCCVGCGLGLDKCPICRIKGRAIKVYRP
mmetsp:Transcript_31186/g.79503  ORF Transcript_31186/g.79503 Transcript_31186/m.79503 type:complete len:485 (-) Transcript_31186:467-1921(-)